MNLAIAEVVKNTKGVVMDNSVQMKTMLVVSQVIIMLAIIPLCFIALFFKYIVGGGLRCLDYIQRNR